MATGGVGEFERLVLLAVLRLGEEAYGAAIFNELEVRTGRTPSPGAIYVALRRLEGKGMLQSWQAESSPKRGGRPKRFYSISAVGREALREARDDWSAMLDGVEARLEEPI